MNYLTKLLQEAFNKIHLLEDDNINQNINEEKVLLDNDDKLVIAKCKDFLDYIYNSNYKDKKSMKDVLKIKFNLENETK